MGAWYLSEHGPFFKEKSKKKNKERSWGRRGISVKENKRKELVDLGAPCYLSKYGPFFQIVYYIDFLAISVNTGASMLHTQTGTTDAASRVCYTCVTGSIIYIYIYIYITCLLQIPQRTLSLFATFLPN